MERAGQLMEMYTNNGSVEIGVFMYSSRSYIMYLPLYNIEGGGLYKPITDKPTTVVDSNNPYWRTMYDRMKEAVAKGDRETIFRRIIKEKYPNFRFRFIEKEDLRDPNGLMLYQKVMKLLNIPY